MILPRQECRSDGFTLIELMITVAIVGILASAALPNLTSFAFKAKRAEGIPGLHGIWIAQATYFAETGHYASTFDQMGFELDGGTRIDGTTIEGPHYTYTMNGISVNGNANQNFRATATGDIDPRDAVLDIIIIENNITVMD